MAKDSFPLKYVQPVYLQKLRDAGHTLEEIGDMIGCSGSHVGNCLQNKSGTLLAYELAAKHLHGEKNPSTDGKVAIIQAAEHILETVKSVVLSTGGKYHVIP